MELKKIHVGTVSYANEAMDEVASYIKQGFVVSDSSRQPLITPSTVFGAQVGTGAATRTRREIGTRVRDLLLALALCHNVTPTTDEEDGRRVILQQTGRLDERNRPRRNRT